MFNRQTGHLLSLKLYLNDVLLVEANQPTILEFLFDPIVPTDEDDEADKGFKFLNYRTLGWDSYPEITCVHFH